jgi:YidC/Oxa1 family membrane protein insertase
VNPLSPILAAIAKTITFFHEIFSPVFGATHGAAWVLSIVFLVVTIRLLLFPIFVKQIKSQRAMQELQPTITALQAKHKGDRETLNQELMKLYKEQGVNPLAGCLPLLIQAPIFIALFQVLRGLSPAKAASGMFQFPERYGVPETTAEQLGRAKVFGAPIGAAFNSPRDLLDFLDTSATSVKIVAVMLIVTMSMTTFLTTRQMMLKHAAAADPQQAIQQKILLYVMPLFLALFGFGVPIGVLIYWTTSNLWSMGQQAWVIRHMPHPSAQPAGTGTTAAAAPTRGAAGGGRVAKEGASADQAPDGTAPPASRPAGRPPQNRSTKKARSQRRGGRR